MPSKRLNSVRMSRSPLQDGGEVWVLTLNPIYVIMEVSRDSLRPLREDRLIETEAKMHEALVTYMGELINDFYREGTPIKDGEPITIRTIPRLDIVSDVKGFRPP